MAFFDWNHDGKNDIWDTLYEYESYRRFSEAWDKEHNPTAPSPGIIPDWSKDFDDSDDFDDDDWREFAEDGFDYGLDPYDYDYEEEYEEALEEAKYAWRDTIDYDPNISLSPEDFETMEEYQEALNELIDDDQTFSETPLILNIGLSLEGGKEVKPEDYPNKRRFKAAQAIAEDYFVFESFREPAKFVNENADKILAANYLSYTFGFLYAQAIKDNFDLPCSLPNEDEEREMDFYQVLAKIAKYDIPLTFKIWEWCLQQFGPYVQYDEYSAANLTKDVFDNIYSFSNLDDFRLPFVRYLNDNYAFCKSVMSLCDKYYYNVAELIAVAIHEKFYDTANILFRIELDKATGHWKEIIDLTNEVIVYCSDGKDLIAMEYFRDNMFPAIKTIEDGMVKDEIPSFEAEMSEYISEIEDSDKYAYSRKNAWRLTVPNGEEYGMDPICYNTEQEYLADLEKAKYSWRKWHQKEKDKYGIDPDGFETAKEFQEAIDKKRRELYEEKEKQHREELQAMRAAALQKQEEEQAELAKDKTIYTYCGVSIPQKARPFSYLSDDSTIKIGDTVLIPFGPYDEEIEGIVVSVGQYTRLAVPYPVEKTKKIIKKLLQGV